MTLPQEKYWTYEDYCELPEDGNRYEVIDGRLYVTAAPLTRHQLISRRIQFRLYELELAGRGYVYNAPVDVLMPGCTPVQPDLVYLRRDQFQCIQEKFIEGSPQLIVEILSPGNPSHDRVVKLRKYAANGVPFYWIVDPSGCTLEVLALDGESYRMVAALTQEDSYEFEGTLFNLAEIFAPLT